MRTISLTLALSGALCLAACTSAEIGTNDCESSSDCAAGHVCQDGTCTVDVMGRAGPSGGRDDAGSWSPEPVDVPDAGPTYYPDTGPTYYPDTGSAHYPDTGSAHYPDTGSPEHDAAVDAADTGSGTVPDSGSNDSGRPDTGGEPPPEQCGNGVDDDRDGQIDENCICTPGESQPCFSGPEELAGVGLCRVGLQRCVADGEFVRWTNCEGAVLPSEEVCGNGMDENCNGVVDDSPLCCDLSDAPEVLIVLDRHKSMQRRTDGTKPDNTEEGRLESKWGLAVRAVEQVVSELGSRIRFGLELLPGNDEGCVTLPQRLAGVDPRNDRCVPGVMTLEPALDAGPAFESVVGVDTTPLCRSAPIGSSLEAAHAMLDERWAGRPQYVVVITDGDETCDSRPVDAVVDLFDAGIPTYVVGFGGNIERSKLNKMACSGHMVLSHETVCRWSDGRWVPTGDAPRDLFFHAENPSDLVDALRLIAGEPC